MEIIDFEGNSFLPLGIPVIIDGDKIIARLPNGKEKEFPRKVSWSGGEIDIVDLSAMKQSILSKEVVQNIFLPGLLQYFDAGSRPLLFAESTESRSMFLPVFRIGERSDIFPTLRIYSSNNTSGRRDFPEKNANIVELETNPVFTLIHSPETGEPLCGIVFYIANSIVMGVYDIDEGGLINYRQMGGGDVDNFGGHNRTDDVFGVVELPKEDNHAEKFLFQAGDGIGWGKVIQSFLEAKTEQEIFTLLSEYRIIFNSADRVVIPEG